jgi:hypothetical protein
MKRGSSFDEIPCDAEALKTPQFMTVTKTIGCDQSTNQFAGDDSAFVQVCSKCGQAFDTRLLHQVIFHKQPKHRAINLERHKGY